MAYLTMRCTKKTHQHKKYIPIFFSFNKTPNQIKWPRTHKIGKYSIFCYQFVIFSDSFYLNAPRYFATHAHKACTCWHQKYTSYPRFSRPVRLLFRVRQASHLHHLVCLFVLQGPVFGKNAYNSFLRIS